MDPVTAEAVRRSFVNCSSKAARAVSVPTVTEQDLADLDFLAWRDSRATDVAYLVAPYPAPDGSRLVGVRLRINGRSGGRRIASSCHLCMTVRPAVEMPLFAAAKAGAAGRNGDTVGTYLCVDLACSAYVRGTRRPVIPQPQETISVEERIVRLRGALNRFLAHVLDGSATAAG